MDNQVNNRNVAISSLNRIWLLIIVIVVTASLLFTGCAPVPAATTPAPAATITQTPAPTPTPTVVQTPTAAPTTTPSPTTAVSLPPIPENFLVEDEYWEYALFVHDADGNPSNAGIIFSGFPEGMKLYAPMSGYVNLGSGDNPFPHVRVRISESADDVTKWDIFGPTTGKFISFHAEEIELLEVGVKDGALYVEEGKPFAEVTKKSELFPGEYKEKPELFVLFNKEWADMLNVSVGDPKQYLWYAIQIYKSEKGN